VTLTEIVTGYTSHVGAKPQGFTNMSEAGSVLVAPDLQFYVNSTIKMQTRNEYGPTGPVSHTGVAVNSHVLADSNVSSIFNPHQDQRMRPTDIFSVMSRSHLHRAAPEQPGAGPSIIDSRTTQNKMAALSRRSNVIPSNYVARVMENYNNANVASLDPTNNHSDFFVKARGYSNDGLVSQDEVLKMLADIRGEAPGNVFLFSDLVRLDPTIQGRVIGRVSGATQRLGGLHTVGQTTKWDGWDPTTVNATIISQCVPGIMADLGLTRMHFKTHNQWVTSGEYSAFNPNTHLSNPMRLPDFVPMNVQGFSKQNLGVAAQAFEQRFWYEVMKDICQDNQVGFMLEVNADLTGETDVRISLDSKPMEQFITPSFADALLTPLVTSNHQHILQVADDFDTMLRAVVKNDSEETNTLLSPHVNF
jgi:hypothetical protein